MNSSRQQSAFPTRWDPARMRDLYELVVDFTSSGQSLGQAFLSAARTLDPAWASRIVFTTWDPSHDEERTQAFITRWMQDHERGVPAERPVHPPTPLTLR